MLGLPKDVFTKISQNGYFVLNCNIDIFNISCLA